MPKFMGKAPPRGQCYGAAAPVLSHMGWLAASQIHFCISTSQSFILWKWQVTENVVSPLKSTSWEVNWESPKQCHSHLWSLLLTCRKKTPSTHLPSHLLSHFHRARSPSPLLPSRLRVAVFVVWLKKCLKKNGTEAAHLWPQSQEEAVEWRGSVGESVHLYHNKMLVFPSSIQRHTYTTRRWLRTKRPSPQ